MKPTTHAKAAALTAALAGWTAGAAAADTAKSWQASCDAYKATPLPAADQPAGTAPKLKGCSSEALYYGIGMPKDPELARQCAYLERGPAAPVFGGAAMLMTVYANGVGAARDVALALRFACELDGAPFEMESRIAHLESLRAAQGQGHDFDLCQDISSGFMSGHCAAHLERLASVERSARLQKLTSEIPGADRAAFTRLTAASDGFIAARTEHEVDLSGTMRSAFQVHEEATLRADFVQMLELYAHGKPHSYTLSEFQKRDAKLKAVLAGIADKELHPQPWGTVTMDGIKTAQAAWEAYRDAFASFAAQRYKHVNAFSVKAWLTTKRIHMLSRFQ